MPRSGLRRAALVAVLGLGLSVASLNSSAAQPRPAGQTAAADRTVFLYQGRSEVDVALDSSRTPDHAAVRTRNGGRLVLGGSSRDAAVPHAGQAGERSWFRFPGGPCEQERCPQVVLQPGDGPDTAVGSGPFVFGARVRLAETPGTAGVQVMQQGADRPGHGLWSLSVDDGQVSCGWSDGTHDLTLPDDLGRSFTLRPGRWYDLRCARTGASSFAVAVLDPMTDWPIAGFTGRATMGAIRPGGRITIGARSLNGGSDARTHQFHGELDDVFLAAG